MSSSSEEEDLFILTCLQAEDEERWQKRFWVHDINKKRSTYGEFHHLFQDLLQDDVKFYQYFRMSPEKFHELKSIIQDEIKKEDTKMRRPISVEERLAVCLR